MISEALLSHLQNAADKEPLAAIVSWTSLGTSAGMELPSPESIAKKKAPFLRSVEEHFGFRVNALPGFPLAIIEAPAELWRDLIKDLDPIVGDSEVELTPNAPEYFALLSPKEAARDSEI